MADDRYDELYQIRQAAAHQRLVQGLQNQAQANLHDYQQALAENDMNAAAFAESEYRRNTRELMEAAGQQPQQAQQQQQQPQQAFTEVEMNILREFPGVASDPKKWNEALAAANALVMRGYDRRSEAYDSALRIAIGLADADGRDGAEISSGDTALEAVNNSQIARRYGAVTPQEYNHYRQHLDALKRAGLRQMDDTP
jgi:hypothetical protein